ncbi:MAG: deoxyguanosinetriphosphate triphosphohydrolase [Alphaproteobacteria bacterium]|nr:deoxyguanosinetriphosphate triphosphohydrolase [Alphaproteobacteria bacterium]
MATEDYGEGLRPGERSPGRYAASAIASRGREFSEPECPTRSPFQRDRDRIIHSTPFRRLLHKTQVFVFHEGDHYRTRLTHTLEVAQIARTIARQLRLDEDLAEALALAHDLGHPPFGHAGERALDRIMADFGGYDHNAQSLKVVMRLERKYCGFDGLNLTWESLEGLAKHNGPIGDAGSSPVAKVAQLLEAWRSLELDQYASAEAQVAALADDIAYVSHDTDDGLRARLLNLSDLKGAALIGPVAGQVLANVKDGEAPRAIYEITRAIITQMVSDCVSETRGRLADLKPGSPDDIRAAGLPVVAFSSSVGGAIGDLKGFLFERVYRHRKVMRVMEGAEQVVADLFQRYLDEPSLLPEPWQEFVARSDERGLGRLVGDFVAGMTDRMAMAEHRRLFDVSPDLR